MDAQQLAELVRQYLAALDRFDMAEVYRLREALRKEVRRK